MPSKPRAPDAEDRLQAALTVWQTGGLYRRLLKRLINGRDAPEAAEESFSAWAATRVVVK